MILGIIALFTKKTDEIITIACFGAIILYIFGMLSVLMLRKKEPGLLRPFRTPFYPFFPIIALAIALFSLIAMITLYVNLFILFMVIMALAYIWFHFFVNKIPDANETNFTG